MLVSTKTIFSIKTFVSGVRPRTCWHRFDDMLASITHAAVPNHHEFVTAAFKFSNDTGVKIATVHSMTRPKRFWSIPHE